MRIPVHKPALLVSLSVITLILIQCNKKDDRGGCFTTTQTSIDSAQAPEQGKLEDSIEVVIYATGGNYCYGNFHVKPESKGNIVYYKGYSDFNHCIDCAQTTKKMWTTHKFKPTHAGSYTLMFENEKGNISRVISIHN